jgi:hypothetical protein
VGLQELVSKGMVAWFMKRLLSVKHPSTHFSC